jgi:hypothetical protein
VFITVHQSVSIAGRPPRLFNLSNVTARVGVKNWRVRNVRVKNATPLNPLLNQMIKSFLAATCTLVCCIGAAEVPGAKPAKAGTISQADMNTCMKNIDLSQPGWPSNVRYDYCLVGISAFQHGYSVEQAAQLGNNYVIQKYSVNNNLIQSILNPQNVFAGSVFRWQDPGSIWD